MTTYSVSELATACGISKTTVAWRLRALGLKSPHTDEHLTAVRDYLVRESKIKLTAIYEKIGDI